MFTLAETRRIAAPAPLVWRLFADVMAWPRWLPTVTRVEATDAARLAIGSSFKLWQPRLRPTTWTVVHLDPGQCFAWEAASPGLRLWANHTVEPSANGGSQLRLEFRFRGILAPFVAPLVSGLTRRYLATEAEAIGTLAEATAPIEA